jgi:hypothetical protein
MALSKPIGTTSSLHSSVDRNFFSSQRARAREKNAVIEEIASRYGQVVDLHAHFLTGDPSWFTATIEPTLRGASEVRRAFLSYVLGKA